MTGDIEGILELGGVAAVEVAASHLTERGAKPGTCKNCAKPLLGAYCAVCGQPTKTRRRSIRLLVHDFFLDLLNFDSKVLRTARALLLQPGELPKAFRQGRMVPYTPAIRLYLFVSLLFFVLLSVTGIAIVQLEVTATPVKIIRDAQGNTFMENPAYDKDDENDPDVKKFIPRLIPVDKKKANQPGGMFSYSNEAHFFKRIGSFPSKLTPEQRKRLLKAVDFKVEGPDGTKVAKFEKGFDGTMQKLAADPAALNGPLTTWIPRALFLLLPLYAFVLALFHVRRRKDFYLVDHLVFSLSVHTFAFVTVIAAVGLAQLLPGEWVATGVFLAISIYIFLAMKNFYEQGWIMTTLKFLLISSTYTIFCLLPAMACVFALSLFGDPFG